MTTTSREAKIMMKPIVVGLDGSRQSQAAADWGARTALRRGLPLRLVHAWQGSTGPVGAETVPPDCTVPQYWARRVLRAAMDRLSERHPQLYISAEQIPRPPREALLAEAESAELLVIGNEGLSSVGALFSASVALAIVAHSPLPVVLVRAGFTAADERRRDGAGTPSADAPFRDVVAAVDLRESCDGVLAFAFDEAARRGTVLRAEHIWHPSIHTPHTSVPRAHAEAQEAGEAALTDLLRPWQEKYPTVPVRAAVVRARTSHEIVHTAEGAGLLVVGRRPRHTGLGPHTGPVTHAVIHHVACPVAVVPHD
ncbi:universal stress protein [Streptomyces sp. NPDC046939]|uniref:universal stress protein n=1 Tax=Streptomyces sp. NPDC046939 TaxID=3155376 RepID=UPI0033FD7716